MIPFEIDPKKFESFITEVSARAFHAQNPDHPIDVFPPKDENDYGGPQTVGLYMRRRSAPTCEQLLAEFMETGNFPIKEGSLGRFAGCKDNKYVVSLEAFDDERGCWRTVGYERFDTLEDCKKEWILD